MKRTSEFLFAAAVGIGTGSGRSNVPPKEPKEAPERGRQPLGAQLNDLEYFQGRAEEEIARAQRATNPAVVAAHYELAERYLELVGRAQLADGYEGP